MSILSSERLERNGAVLNVTEKEHCVEIEFDIGHSMTRPATTGYGSGTMNVQNVVIANGNLNHLQDNNFVAWNNNVTSTSTTSSWYTMGFKLFFQGGFLRCLKKEVAYFSVVQAAAVSNPQSTSQHSISIPAGDIRKSLIHPVAITYDIWDHQMMIYIQAKLLSLAERKGIIVPQKYLAGGIINEGVMVKPFYAFLDWLAYPLFREIDSLTLSKNLVQYYRDLICPNKIIPMNFKQLVEYYYGTSTNKMLEEIWKVLVLGLEFRKVQFNLPPGQIEMAMSHMAAREDMVEIGPDYAVGLGDRCLQPWTFTFGPAILKTMGFDYFYQAVPFFGEKSQYYEKNPDRRVPAQEWSESANFEDMMKLLLRDLTPKKVINMIAEEGFVYRMHYLKDAVNMLRQYDNVNTIPPVLRAAYPDGLRPNFKFKTAKEFHDKISTQYTIIKTEADKKEIPIHDLYRKLDGMESKGLKLVVPTNTSQLSTWGKDLSICVASYGDSAAVGTTLILGVEKDGVIKYCIEFHSAIFPVIDGESVGDAHVFSQADVPSEVKIERLPITRIEEKMAQVSSDYLDEAGIYYEPAQRQFRGIRNGDPTTEDRVEVDGMLIKWVMDNLEEFKKLMPDVIHKDFSASWHEQFGRPDQIIMNQAEHQAMVEVLGGDDEALRHGIGEIQNIGVD